MNFLGIDIGGTKCSVVLGDKDGNILKKENFATTSKDETIKKIIDTAKTFGDFVSIGISCGGPLDSKKGIIKSPPNLPYWDNVKITEILENEFGVKAYLENDANACALAEWKFGAGEKCRNMIFLTFGTGLGAGLILDYKLYRGSSDMAGEVGHIRLNDYGPVGYGKIGSFEGFCSGGGIAQLGKMKALELFGQGKKCDFCPSISDMEDITAKKIAQSAKNGDQDAKDVFKMCAKMLGRGLSILIDILNPDIIVLGSIYPRCIDLIEPYMNEVIIKETLPYSQSVCNVKKAGLGEMIGDVASLSIAIDSYERTINNE